MIVRTLNDVKELGHHVNWGNGTSSRLLVENDGVGYTITDTYVEPNSSSLLQYTSHLESCFCISGKGEVINDITHDTYHIEPGTVYVLDKNEPHHLNAGDEGLRLVCVFLPALTGAEVHKLNGGGASSY